MSPFEGRIDLLNIYTVEPLHAMFSLELYELHEVNRLGVSKAKCVAEEYSVGLHAPSLVNEVVEAETDASAHVLHQLQPLVVNVDVDRVLHAMAAALD